MTQSLCALRDEHGLVHLRRALDAHDVDGATSVEGEVASDGGHERDARAHARGRFGERVALTTRRAIREHAHRIDRLARAPRADQHRLAAQLAAVSLHDALHQRGHLARDQVVDRSPHRRRRVARRRARGPVPHGGAGWRDSPGPRAAPTSRCASPDTAAPARASRARWRSTGHRRDRSRSAQ